MKVHVVKFESLRDYDKGHRLSFIWHSGKGKTMETGNRSLVSRGSEECQIGKL